MIAFRGFTFDPERCELRKAGRAVHLQPQPARLLALLLSRAGEIVTREEIQRSLWSDATFVDFDQSINYCVKRIREVLGDDADNPLYVQTVPRRGYRFVAEVNAPAASGAPGQVTSARRSPPLGVWLVVLGGLALAIAALTLGPERRPRSDPAAVLEPRFQMTLPRGVMIDQLPVVMIDISRRGDLAAFVGRVEGGDQAIYVRRTSDLDARRVPGTLFSFNPFFSPDGRWLGFTSNGQLQKVNLDTGAVVALAAAPSDSLRGASWGDDGTILFSAGGSGILHVSA